VARISRTAITTIAALATLALVASAVRSEKRPGSQGDVILQGDTIVVNGRDVTLRDLAARIGDEKVFAYDSVSKTALANTSLTIHGRLTLGSEHDPTLRETLELNSATCGHRRILITESGELHIHNSVLATESRIVTEEMCTRGYTLYCKGRLVMDRGQVTYMSGSYSRNFWRTSSARLANSTFCLNDGSSASFFDPDGERLHIDNCTFSSKGNWGIVVRGKDRSPLRITSSTFFGSAGDVLNAGDHADVHLVDCKFRKGKIHFSQLTGTVAVKWRLNVRVVGEDSGAPVSGLRVRATSSNPSPLAETVEATTDAGGVCVLELTEYVARPRAKERRDGVNSVAPHDMFVYGETTRGQRAQRTRVDVRAAGQTCVLRSPG